MARIAGLATRAPDGPALLDGMLAASRARPGWIARTERAGHALLGATGWTEPPTAARGGSAAVLDGLLLDRAAIEAEVGPARNDAELVLALHEKHGFLEAVRRLEGDFALALLDGPSGTLWLARDRFGVKPLYHAHAAAGFAFASRPRALLSLPGVARDPRPAFVGIFAGGHYRAFDNDTERSPYAAIAQLPAGHVLEVRGERALLRRYASIEDADDLTAPEGELASTYRGLLLEAVGRRLERTPRPAFTLSGGMDSSSVLACAVHLTGRKQTAFSTVYSDRTYDESDEIRSMLASNVSRWRPVPIGTPDVLSLVRRLVAVHDEPVATATWLSHFLLCEVVRAEGFDSLYGGLGGDELNAGEYEHFLYHFADLRARGEEARLAHEIERWVAHHDHPIWRKSAVLVNARLPELVDLAQPGRCRTDRARLDRYARAVRPSFFDVTAFEPVLDHPFRSYLGNRTYQDVFRETAPCCLRAMDRHGAEHELEHVSPFFDRRLAELAFRLPGVLKIRDGVTKVLLREAMRGLLPEETRTRIKKTGWNAPAHVWFSGSGRGALLDLVRSRAFRERGIYDLAEVERLILEHDAIVSSGQPRENHMMFLWQLVNLELWLEDLATISPGGSRTPGG